MKTEVLRKIEESKCVEVDVNGSNFKTALIKIVNHKCYFVIYAIIGLLAFLANFLLNSLKSNYAFCAMFFTLPSIAILMPFIKLPFAYNYDNIPKQTFLDLCIGVCLLGFNLTIFFSDKLG